jgi:hypothetical protein
MTERMETEMKKNKLCWLLVLMVAVLVVGCSKIPDGGSGGDLPRVDTSDEKNLETGDSNIFQDQEFDFEMFATVNGLVDVVGGKLIDTLESDWIGTFTIDQDYEMTGKGTLTYEAAIYSVDEKECGYRWIDKGTIKFVIGGKVHADGVVYVFPVKIQYPFPPPEIRNLSGPEATCSDPDDFYADVLENYIPFHREGLFGAVLKNLHMTLGWEIRPYMVLEKKVGTINYVIKVENSVIPLSPD